MILYLDMPGFYAAVEQADHSDLRGRPVVVGGNPGKRGIVTGASLEARRRGVEEGGSVREALKLCPEAMYRPTRLRRYREVSAEISALLRDVTDRIEAQGIASFYLEPPATTDALSLGGELCVRLRAELSLEAVAGVGPTRFVAQLAARHHRPGEVRQVLEEEIEHFLAPFVVTELWGLGPATAEKLAGCGVETIGQLRDLDRGELEAVVGRRNAAAFLSLSRGGERDALRPMPSPKTLSRERTLREPSRDLRSLADELADLARRLERMLQRERRAARTVSLALGYVDGDQQTRSQTLSEPIQRGDEIREVALELLGRTQAAVRHCRRLRLQLSQLTRVDQEQDARQLRLF